MYPLNAPRLSLLDLARHWRRDIPQKPAAEELEDLLLRAFWRGDLPMALPGAGDAQATDPRIRLLNGCRRAPQDAGLLRVDRAEDLPPETTELGDGGLQVDLRKRVVWPADQALQTTRALSAACAAMSAAEFGDYHDLVKPLLALLAAERDAFGAFCTRSGYPLPAFWFARNAGRASAKAAADCRRWFRGEVAAGRKRLSRKGYLAEAQARFPGLSERSFRKVWDDEAPAAWRRRGRPPAHLILA